MEVNARHLPVDTAYQMPQSWSEIGSSARRLIRDGGEMSRFAVLPEPWPELHVIQDRPPRVHRPHRMLPDFVKQDAESAHEEMRARVTALRTRPSPTEAQALHETCAGAWTGRSC